MTRIRKATVDDTAAVARLHVVTFNQAHAPDTQDGPPFEVREYQWRKILAKQDPMDFCLVVEDTSGELIGFARGVRHKDDPNFQGALNKIYVLEEHHREGHGRCLLGAVAREFQRLGINSMLLFGDAHSDANSFHEHFGGERLYNKSGGFDGSYGWRDLGSLAKPGEAEAGDRAAVDGV